MKFQVVEKQEEFNNKLIDLTHDNIGITATGDIYMRGYDPKVFWCLNNKGMTYSDGAPESIAIRILPKGSKIEIVV